MDIDEFIYNFVAVSEFMLVRNIFKITQLRWLALIAIFMFCSNARAQKEQDNYKIEIQLDGISDSVCYLANYYGDKTYLTDTAIVNGAGYFVFEGDSMLPGGIYIVAGQRNNKFFELIVDHEQQFKVTASVSGIPADLEFVNSTDNVLFYDYIRSNIAGRKKIESLRKLKDTPDLDPDSVIVFDNQIKNLSHQLDAYEDSLINASPQNFVSVILRAKQEPGLAPPKYLANGREDSVFAYQSYKEHYWDNLNPADERLLRTPLFYKRLKSYFENVIYQDPDTLILEADKFIARAQKNKETFKFVVWYLTYKFETSNVMGFDEVLVHMVDSYYANGLAYWTEPSVVKTLVKRADELRPTLIGSNAPNLILMDTTGSFKALYALDARYVVVFFYEYGCSHCRKEIAALEEWYPENAYNAKIFAVCTDTSLVDWKKYSRKIKQDWVHVNATRSVTADYHGLYDIRVTPTIYLLDNRKKIIAKRLKVEQLIPFIESYDKRNQE